MYNKTIIKFGFCDIQNNQGLGKGYQPQPSASADNSYLDLDYSGYHKNLIQELFIIASITKFSIVIGSPRAYMYLSRNWCVITWVSNYRCPI